MRIFQIVTVTALSGCRYLVFKFQIFFFHSFCALAYVLLPDVLLLRSLRDDIHALSSCHRSVESFERKLEEAQVALGVARRDFIPVLYVNETSIIHELCR